MKLELHGRIEEMGDMDDLPQDAQSGVKFNMGDVTWVLPLTPEATREVAKTGLLFKDLTITISLEEA